MYNTNKNNLKVSVIIPVFNREDLIKETLDSIIAQSYQHWECIVVDDGSQDDSLKLLEEYSEKDSRIRYYSRPGEMPKGANSCRNFGFKKSKGDYIIWFDSDDLMTPKHIESKLERIRDGEFDFVVARTRNFRDGKMLVAYTYEKKAYGIKASDFILLKIHWYTYDVMLKRRIAEQISWNEEMRSWQDYNYFCKMLLLTEHGTYLDEILTYRRLHSNSIQKDLTKSSGNFRSELLENRLLTFNDLEAKVTPETKRELIYGLMNLCFETGRSGSMPKLLPQIVRITGSNLGKLSGVNFILSVLFARIFKKGNFMLELAKSRHKELRD